jgi:meso-butanediol dehydrogenase / (S,S)-butanediol dehydrogenase / diacetyl reductase
LLVAGKPRLEDKIVVVTGAGAGIGEAAALRFLEEGARVLAVDRDPAALNRLQQRISERPKSAGAPESDRLQLFAADVSRQEGAAGMIQAAVDHFGRLDGLFNNAGIVAQGTVEETSEEDWDRQMAINPRSVFLGCKAALPVLRRQGGGASVNTASTAGLVAVKSRAAYSASKGAIIGLSKSMALDHAHEQIRVNCICPGTVDTPSWRERVASSPDPDEALRMFISRQPMGRVAYPEEAAAAALYLLSDEAAFITGICLVLDGGWSA